MSKTLAEQLVELFPKEWEAFELVDTSEISCVDYKFSLDEPDDYGDNPHFINWALDELAKKGYAPNLEYDDSYGWCVSFSPPKSQRDYTETYPTKTLALAHALVEVCGE